MAGGEKKTAWISGACSKGDGLERVCLSEMIKGRRAQGRQLLKYKDRIKEILVVGEIEEVVRLTENKGVWGSIVANATSPAVRLGH